MIGKVAIRLHFVFNVRYEGKRGSSGERGKHIPRVRT